MFPKSTISSPQEKPSTKSAVVVMSDRDMQPVVAGSGHKKASIYACTTVVITLIVVAGTLGAITLVLTHGGTREDTSQNNPEGFRGGDYHPGFGDDVVIPDPSLPTKPGIIIDNGGLWPVTPKGVTPDLVAVDATDNDVVIVDGVDGTTDDGLSGDGGESTAFVSSSSEDEMSSSSSSYDTYGQRNWISSSFPYDGYYMRGGVGPAPWDQEGWKEPGQEEEKQEESGQSGSGSGDQETDDQMTVQYTQ